MVIALFAILAVLGLTQKVTSSFAATAQEDVLNNDVQTHKAAATAQESIHNNDVQTYAENDSNYETYLSFSITQDGKSYRVRAKNKTMTEIAIPSTYNGLPVSEILDNGFMACRSMKYVFIPATVKKIGSNAFYSCTVLERVYGAINVENIGNSAFAGCTNLKYFCVYDSITTMGSTVFRNVSNDVYIRMDEQQFAGLTGINTNWSGGLASGSQIIYGKENICEAIDEANTEEGYRLIQAKIIDVPVARAYAAENEENGEVFECAEEKNGKWELIREIEQEAFAGWNNEKLIINYDSKHGLETGFTVYLNQGAFASMMNCKYLEINVNISIEKEGEYSTDLFMASEKLEEVKMPDAMDKIPENTFNGCLSLTTLQYNDVENAESANNNDPSAIILSEKINFIDNYAFATCLSISEIRIPSKVTSMGMCVFQSWGSENYETGETKNQKIVIDNYLPPESTDEFDTWDKDLGEAASIEYKTMTVKLNSRGGIGGTQSVEAMYGRPLPAADAPSPDNGKVKEFRGYFSTTDISSTQFYDENMNCMKEWGEEEIRAGLDELYAYWGKKAIPIDLILDDDDNCEHETTVFYEEKFEPINVETDHKLGYKFNGFYSERNGAGVQFYDSALNPTDNKYTDLSIEVLYAYWTPIRYQVALLSNGGMGGVQKIYVDYGTKDIYLSENDLEPVSEIAIPQRDYYTFQGYYTDEGIQYFSVVDVDGVLMARCVKDWDKAKNLGLDALWETVKFKITYKSFNNDGSDYIVNYDIEDIENSEGKVYRQAELKKVNQGIKTSWAAISITIEKIGDKVIESTTGIAPIVDCLDSETGTYKIWYPSQLDEMRLLKVDKYGWIIGNFELVTDIDLKDFKNWIPLPCLFGSFNGNSHTISGMNIVVRESGYYGLFSRNDGSITRLTVNGTIKIESDIKDVYVGLLCGMNTGTGRIERCYTEKGTSYSIDSRSNDAFVGGLVGYNSGVIYNVANRAGITGDGNIGGIVGKNEGTATTSFISLASSQGEIYVKKGRAQSIGGIVAVMTGGRIESCTCTGKIKILCYPDVGEIAAPRVGKVVGTWYENGKTSYGTQMAVNSIEIEGKYVPDNIGGDVGKTI